VWQYEEPRWLTEMSESIQIKQSKESRMPRKSLRASKRHPFEGWPSTSSENVLAYLPVEVRNLKVQMQLAFYLWSKIVNFPLIFA